MGCDDVYEWKWHFQIVLTRHVFETVYLVKDHTQSKHIGSLRNFLATEGNFGSAVGRRSLKGPRRCRSTKGTGRIFAQTEVHDYASSVLLANDVCRFEIAVDDILLSRYAESWCLSENIANCSCAMFLKILQVHTVLMKILQVHTLVFRV